MAAVITEADITDGIVDSVTGEWTGTKIFDVLINAVNKNIEIQYDKGRITSTDYATVYLGSLQSVIEQSVRFVLNKQQAEKQADLITRQTAGFDDDARLKYTRQLLDAWGVLYANGTGSTNPNKLGDAEVDSILTTVSTSLGL